jgi:hypothetical protein
MSNASHAAVGLAYGVSGERVRQWRERMNEALVAEEER